MCVWQGCRCELQLTAVFRVKLRQIRVKSVTLLTSLSSSNILLEAAEQKHDHKRRFICRQLLFHPNFQLLLPVKQFIWMYWSLQTIPGSECLLLMKVSRLICILVGVSVTQSTLYILSTEPRTVFHTDYWDRDILNISIEDWISYASSLRSWTWMSLLYVVQTKSKKKIFASLPYLLILMFSISWERMSLCHRVDVLSILYNHVTHSHYHSHTHMYSTTVSWCLRK